MISNKVNLAKNFHIQPSEIDKMSMWEYEMFMTELNKIIKKENKEQQDEMDKYHVKDFSKMTNPNSLHKLANPQMPKMPSMKIPSM